MQRRTDTLMSGLMTFLVGLIVGVLTAFSTFSGRIASTETTLLAHGHAIERMTESVQTLSDRVSALLINERDAARTRKP